SCAPERGAGRLRPVCGRPVAAVLSGSWGSRTTSERNPQPPTSRGGSSNTRPTGTRGYRITLVRRTGASQPGLAFLVHSGPRLEQLLAHHGRVTRTRQFAERSPATRPPLAQLPSLDTSSRRSLTTR